MEGLLFGEKLGPMPLTTVVNTLQTTIEELCQRIEPFL